VDVAESEAAEPRLQALQDPSLGSLWRWQTLLSLIVTLGLLAFLASYIDFDALWQDIAGANISYLLLGSAAHYATYPVRGQRWRKALGSRVVNIPVARLGLIVFFYNAVDNILPAKLGDLYAAHLARLNFRIRRSSALGSLVFLRLVDVWIVLSLAGISAWFVFSSKLPSSVTWVLGGGALLALAVSAALVTMLILGKSMPHWIPGPMAEMISEFRLTLWPARCDRPAIALLTVVIWVLETLWMFWLVKAFGVELTFWGLIFLTQAPLLASAFPLTPSGAGAVEVTLFGCLVLLGVPSALAVTITVVNRAIDYWLHIALGALIWAMRNPLGLYSLRERDKLLPLPDHPSNPEGKD
jgi:uncharacterized protein (TIRG00374 family)